MTRKRLLLLLAFVAIAFVEAIQVVASSRPVQFVARADIPTVAPGTDVLAGIAEIPPCIRGFDYRRHTFGDTGTGDNPAPGGHNDILDGDLVDKTYPSIKRCPNAGATVTLHDPYTNAVITFARGNQVGAAVQIEHVASAISTQSAVICAGQSTECRALTVVDGVPMPVVA